MKPPLPRYAPPPSPVAASGFFSAGLLDDPTGRVSWEQRAREAGAAPFDRAQGAELFAQRWGADRYVAALSADEIERMSRYFDFVRVPDAREVIGQNEHADYMVIVLDGTLKVERIQPGGARAHLADAQPGDMLGEMSLFDAGTRFSACTTVGDCTLGALDAQALDRMVAEEPRLGVALLASLSRRLSLRLRQVSVRLGALLARGPAA